MVIADTQTAGRGQRGNSWESEPGRNLTFTLLHRPEGIAPREQFAISEATALAIADFLGETGIGVGLNVNQREFRSDAPNPVSMANLLGADTDISRVAARVGAHLEARLSLASTPEGREKMHREFKRRLWRGDGATHPFRRRDTGGIFPGVITDVSPEGPISILDTASGSTSIFMFKEVEFLL